MAITYQSIQSNTAGSGTTIVVTKPTSLAVGDLMIATSVYSANNGITLPAGFSTIQSDNLNGLRSFISGYKIATAGDVAASNFTFTMGSTISFATASLIRYTTTVSFPANPVIASQLLSSSTSTATPSFTLNQNSGPSTTQLLAFYLGAVNTSSSARSSSPSRTWTMINNYNSNPLVTDLAYAPNTTAETITSYTTTIGVAGQPHNLIFIVIGETANATADISNLAVTPTVEGITATQVNVSTDVSHNAIVPTLEGITGKSSSDGTQWTNPDKPSTTWTNPNK